MAFSLFEIALKGLKIFPVIELHRGHFEVMQILSLIVVTRLLEKICKVCSVYIVSLVCIRPKIY